MKKNIIFIALFSLLIGWCTIDKNIWKSDDFVLSWIVDEVNQHIDMPNVTWYEELEWVGSISITGKTIDYAGVFEMSLPVWFQSIDITDIGGIVEMRWQNSTQLLSIYSPVDAKEFDYCDMIYDSNDPIDAKVLKENLTKNEIQITTYTKTVRQDTLYTPFLTQICFVKENMGYKIRIYDDNGYAQDIVNSIRFL